MCATSTAADAEWHAFRAINRRRRAVRHFDDRPIADDVVRAVLAEALLAPSSGNAQPYEFHWVRDRDLRRTVASACNVQQAAATAATLIVVAAGAHIAGATMGRMRAHVESSPLLSAETRAYHVRRLNTFARFLRFAPWPCCGAAHSLVTLLCPALGLLPFGAAGLRHWTARSAIYAAQNLLLAATAYGLDSCPMEGFNAARVTRLLALPRGTVIPIVIGLGYRAPEARVEPRWRRSFEHAVIIH
jgi:nitroreductase